MMFIFRLTTTEPRLRPSPLTDVRSCYLEQSTTFIRTTTNFLDISMSLSSVKCEILSV